MEGDKKKVTFSIDGEVYHNFRKVIQKRGLKVSFMVEKLMRDFLEKEKEFQEAHKRVYGEEKI